jgi:hypothetical protein
MMKVEFKVMFPQAKKGQGLPATQKLRKTWNGFSPGGCGENMSRLTN